VADEEQRQDQNSYSHDLELDIEIRQNDCERAGDQVINKRITRNLVSRLAERNVRRQKHGERDGNLIHNEEHYYEGRESNEIHVDSVESYVTSQLAINEAPQTNKQHVLSSVE